MDIVDVLREIFNHTIPKDHNNNPSNCTAIRLWWKGFNLQQILLANAPRPTLTKCKFYEKYKTH